MVTSKLSGPVEDSAAPVDDSGEERTSRRLFERRVVRVGLLLLLLLLDLIVPIAHARQVMHEAPTFHLDGSFQTVSGLLRLSRGDWPGKDFFPYLGIGPVVALYPVFKMMGGTLSASVFSSFFMTMLSLQLVVGLTTALIFRRRPVWAILWAAAVPAVAVAAAMVRPELWGAANGLLANAGMPGNSLRPIRAAAPYLLALVAFFVLRPRWTPRRAAVVGAVAGVVGAIWSNDYGVVSAVVIVVLVTVHVVRWRLAPMARGLGALWGGAALGYVVSGFLATAGYFIPLLRYNFVDVREDQFWYFGDWNRTDRIYSLGDLYRVMRLEDAIYPLVVLLFAAIYGLVSRDLGALLVSFVGASEFAGGLAATVGGHSGGYFWSFVLWGYVVTAVAIVRAVVVGLARVPNLRRWLTTSRIGRTLYAVPAAVTVVALVVAGISALRVNRETAAAIVADPGHVYEPGLGGFLPVAFQGQIDTVKGRGSHVLEEYMGLAGAINGPNPGLRVDSVIAALGDQRKAFADQLQKRPDLVVTTVPTVNVWPTWGVSANWWFYRTLFNSYAPVQTSPMTLDWRPRAPVHWAPVGCDIRGQQIALAARSAGWFEVTLHYRGPGRNSRAYSMVENNINFAMSAQGFVALDPGAPMQQFPVAIPDPGSGTTLLPLRNVSKDGGQVTELQSCTASAITVPPGAATMDLYKSFMLTPVDLTDGNWARGLSRVGSGLFINNTTINLTAVRNATGIRLADGQKRRITSVQPFGPYINVYFDGAPPDPAVDGAPNPFTLLH